MLDLWAMYTMHSIGVVPNSELYSEALNQAAFLDEHGFHHILLGEHHNTSNSYLPSPLLLAAAMAARTERIRFDVMAVAPLLNPLRLAEDAAVLDNLTAGRVDLSLLLGYRPSEAQMFGTTMSSRVRDLNATLEVLKSAFTGEPFEYRDQRIQITPPPIQRGGPPIFIGGAAEATARRAARLGHGFHLNGGGGSDHARNLFEIYTNECKALGRDPGRVISHGPIHMQVSLDPERTWHQIAPHAFSELDMYNAWAHEAGDVNHPLWDPVEHEVARLKNGGLFLVLTPEDCIKKCRELEAMGISPLFDPLVGGFSPETSWEGLELFVSKVLPSLDDLRDVEIRKDSTASKD